MKTQIYAPAGLLLLTAACTTTAPRRQFEDIQLPTGLSYQPGRSVVIESPSVKAAQLVYRGRLEPESLGDALRARLEANRWRPIFPTARARDGNGAGLEKGTQQLPVPRAQET